MRTATETWQQVLSVVRSRVPRPAFLWLLLAIAAIKGIVLALDARPALLMGDSASYLATAYMNYIPMDRSFTFGLLLRAVALWPHSLHVTVLFQSVLSALSAWSVALILFRYFKTSLQVAIVCSLFCAIEPLQLLHERYIMTETLSTFLLSVLLLAAFEYLSTSNLLWLILVPVIAVSVATVRVNFLPIAIIFSFLLPLITRRSVFRLRNFGMESVSRRLIAPVLLSVLLSCFLFSGYEKWYGHLMTPRQPPAFFYSDGYFLASAFAPVIRPIDYPFADQRNLIFPRLTYPLADRRLRDFQRWSDTGLCTLVIRASGGDIFRGNKLTKKTALRAAKRDPLGVVRLGAATFFDYFDLGYFQNGIRIDEGESQYVAPWQVADFRKYFNADFTQPYVDSFTKKWHRLCWLWYWLVLCLPILFLLHALARFRQATSYHWICVMLGLILFAGATLMAVRPTARYLTTSAWLSFLMLGAAWSDVRTRTLAEAGFIKLLWRRGQ